MQNDKLLLYFSTYDDIKNPYYGGGGAIAIHEVAKRLSKKYDVHVISWDYNGKKKETIDGVRYERFGVASLSPKIAMFAYQLGLPFIALSKNSQIWFESFCPPFTTAFLPLYTKRKVVGIVHMLAAEDMERKYKLPFHLIQNSGIKLYKHIITTSEAVKGNVLTIYPACLTTVISNGIQKVYKPLLHKKKYFLFIGRIEIDQKGLDLLLNAFKKFHSENNTYKLVIAGTGNPKELKELKELIKQNDLTKNVELKGKVGGKIKEQLFKEAACVVISSRFETYSLVALEAMANGAPLICFAIDGLSWIPKNAAKRVKSFDINGLAKAFNAIISNKAETTMLIKQGNTYAKQFTWDVISEKYVDYINNIK